MNRRPWTDAEIVAVYTRFATCRTADLAAELGRTPRSVYAVAERLGLRKDPAVIRATRLRTLAGCEHELPEALEPPKLTAPKLVHGGRA